MISYEDYGNMILISVRVNIQDIVFFFKFLHFLLYLFVLNYLMDVDDGWEAKERSGRRDDLRCWYGVSMYNTS